MIFEDVALRSQVQNSLTRWRYWHRSIYQFVFLWLSAHSPTGLILHGGNGELLNRMMLKLGLINLMWDLNHFCSQTYLSVALI